MNHLKDLVVKANSSFSSSQKKPNQRFGLSNFIAASTDQMLMTRGGYGAVTTLLSSCMHGSVGQCNRYPCNQKTWVDGGSDGNGSSGNGSSGGTTGALGGQGATFSQFVGAWFYKFCGGCSNLDKHDLEIRKTVTSGLGTLLISSVGHNTGCGGQSGASKRHTIWVGPNDTWP